MNLVFEEAKPADAAAIDGLYRQLVRDQNINVSADQIESLQSDDFNFLFVGRFSESVVATAFLTICRDAMYGNQPFAVVENVFVHPGFRRHGFGMKLMDHVKSTCKARRCTKIMLLSSSKRIEAHAFFEKCGYEGSIKKGFVNYINR